MSNRIFDDDIPEEGKTALSIPQGLLEDARDELCKMWHSADDRTKMRYARRLFIDSDPWHEETKFERLCARIYLIDLGQHMGFIEKGEG